MTKRKCDLGELDFGLSRHLGTSRVENVATSLGVGGQLLPLWPLSWPFISQLDVASFLFELKNKRRSRRPDDIRFLSFTTRGECFCRLESSNVAPDEVGN